MSLISSIFSKEEAETIYGIPLSVYGQQQDLLIWRGFSTGDFTVRSAYLLENERQEVNRGESSSNSDKQYLWRLIWGLRVPNPGACRIVCC
jgi:hypothetical protein